MPEFFCSSRALGGAGTTNLRVPPASARRDPRRHRHYKKHLPDYLHISPPALFQESGWLIDGMIVNYAAMAYWERLAARCIRPAFWIATHRIV